MIAFSSAHELGPASERWLSVDEIATHLGISKVSVYKWVEAGKIPGHKVGRQWKFRVSEVDHWVLSGGAEVQKAEI